MTCIVTIRNVSFCVNIYWKYSKLVIRIFFIFCRFLYDMSQIPNYADRIFCFMFHSNFQENVSAIDNKLNNLKMTCEVSFSACFCLCSEDVVKHPRQGTSMPELKRPGGTTGLTQNQFIKPFPLGQDTILMKKALLKVW